MQTALAVVNSFLPFRLAEDPEFLPRADLERLVQLAQEIQTLEEIGTDRSERIGVRFHAGQLLKNLTQLGIGLSGHLKTGHRGSLQNRPTGRSQDLRLLYRIWGRRGKGFCGVGRAGVATRPGPSFLTRFLELPGPTNGRP